MNNKIIDIGKDFSRYPAGRYPSDGPFNGEIFRENFLVPALENKQLITVELDNTAGYGSSFLEEAFGGLVRDFYKDTTLIRQGFSVETINSCISFKSEDQSLIEEINEYITDAETE